MLDVEVNIVLKFADCCGNLFMLSVCAFDDRNYLYSLLQIVGLVIYQFLAYIRMGVKLGAIAVILIYGRFIWEWKSQLSV